MNEIHIMEHILYHGDCFNLIPNLSGTINHIITDPPYSKKTHNGHRVDSKDNFNRKDINYTFLTEVECRLLCNIFHSICDGWIVWMTDHTLVPFIIDEFNTIGRYVFAPLPYYAPGSTCRLSGDGPCSWTIWIVVSRTKRQRNWRTLPGGYINKPGWKLTKDFIGGKPIQLMEEIIRDYSNPGEFVLDPFMGSGTTGGACLNTGRKFIGIEKDKNNFDQAVEKIKNINSQFGYKNPNARGLF